LPGNFLFAAATAELEQNEAQKRYIVIPADLVLAVWAIRAPQKRFSQIKPINHNIEEAADNEAKEKKDD